MQRVPMENYETAHQAFQWDVLDTFNFGTDVVDKWPDEPDKLALIW